MNQLHRLFGTGVASDERTSLWADLRAGRVHLATRIVLSLTTGLLLGAMIAFLIGIAEANGNYVRGDTAAAIAVGAAVLWIISLGVIWGGYKKIGRVIATIVVIAAIWGVAIVISVVVEDAFVREEGLIAGILLFAGAASCFVGVRSWHASRRGKTVQRKSGPVNVHCPACNYSMVGLTSCTCPECGWHATVDALIEAQQYDMHQSG